MPYFRGSTFIFYDTHFLKYAICYGKPCYFSISSASETRQQMLSWPQQYFTVRTRDALGKEKGEILRYIAARTLHVESFSI